MWVMTIFWVDKRARDHMYPVFVNNRANFELQYHCYLLHSRPLFMRDVKIQWYGQGLETT